MTRRALSVTLAAAISAVLVAQAQPARTQDPVFSVNYDTNYLANNGLLAETDEDFLKQAARMSAIALQAARLALTKASRADVKAFAEEIVRYHTATTGELTQFAGRKKVVLSDTDPDVKMKLDRYASLQSRTAANFDREFLAALMTHQSEMIVLFANESRNTRDAALKTFVAEALGTLRAQNGAARKLSAKLSNTP